MKIYCISILRVCEPGIKNYELKEAYETGFLSELYPGVALSKNTVSTFLNDLGKTVSRALQPESFVVYSLTGWESTI